MTTFYKHTWAQKFDKLPKVKRPREWQRQDLNPGSLTPEHGLRHPPSSPPS